MKRAYGSGSIYRRPGAITWSIQWRELGDTKYKGGFPSVVESKKALRAITDRVRRGAPGLPSVKTTSTVKAEMEPWLDAREAAGMADTANERSRWHTHIEPILGNMAITEVTEATIYDFVMSTDVRAQISAPTIGRCVALLSSFFTDLALVKKVPCNPVAKLPQKIKRLLRSKVHPKTIKVVETPEQADAVWAAMPEMFQVAYAVGCKAGLRPGEVLALCWEHIRLWSKTLLRSNGERLEAIVGVIKVQAQVRGGKITPPKDLEPREVPVGPTLGAILTAWRERTGGKGALFFPVRPVGCCYRTPDAKTWTVQWYGLVEGGYRLSKSGFATQEEGLAFLHEHTKQIPPQRSYRGSRPGSPSHVSRKALRAALAVALVKVGLPPIPWYAATRHTFATHWMRAGGPIDRLRDILGHSSITVTERYIHSTFSDDDFLRLETV